MCAGEAGARFSPLLKSVFTVAGCRFEAAGRASRFDSGTFFFSSLWSHLLFSLMFPVIFQHDIGLSLKLECEKLASEKTEMQRHYVMVSAGANTLARFSLMYATETTVCDFDLAIFPFPVLRNVVRAEHRDAQAGKRALFLSS